MMLRGLAPRISAVFNGPDDRGEWAIELAPERARRYRDVDGPDAFDRIERALVDELSPSSPSALPAVTSVVSQRQDSPGMSISPRTIAALVAPFEGGGGPTHTSIE